MPSWITILIIISMVLSSGNFLIKHIHSYLAFEQPVYRSILVVEAWLPDYAIDPLLDIFHSGSYDLIVVTGAQEIYGRNKINYNNTVELFVAKLEFAGLKRSSIVGLMEKIDKKQRTYHAALNLKKWLSLSNSNDPALDVVSLGVHSRRSFLIYKDALGPKYTVGVRSLKNRNYDYHQWWKSSAGFRIVFGELIAYAYVIVFL